MWSDGQDSSSTRLQRQEKPLRACVCDLTLVVCCRAAVPPCCLPGRGLSDSSRKGTPTVSPKPTSTWPWSVAHLVVQWPSSGCRIGSSIGSSSGSSSGSTFCCYLGGDMYSSEPSAITTAYQLGCCPAAKLSVVMATKQRPHLAPLLCCHGDQTASPIVFAWELTSVCWIVRG